MTHRLTHGGDWAGFEAAYGRQPLDFSANISPLGVPEGVREALRSAAGRVDRYPDPLCRELRRALSRQEGVPEGDILCGSGAAALIFRAAQALQPKRALVTAPTFAEYETALAGVGCTVERHVLSETADFRLDGTILDRIVPGLDLLFLCEPNNPTGVTTPRSLLLQVLERCWRTSTTLVVDECFADLLDDPASHTLRDCLAAFPNLIILKAFTKLYAMAGVRLGYALCADEALLERMWAAGQPWEVSLLAQMAGVAALGEGTYVQRVRETIAVERPWLAGELARMGLRVVPGEANYLLFRSPRPLLEPLRQRGILLRGCGNYDGLDASWYRTAVRIREENQRLITALEEVLV